VFIEIFGDFGSENIVSSNDFRRSAECHMPSSREPAELIKTPDEFINTAV
jgi:hypothetical protein